MSDMPRLIPAPISLVFSEVREDNKEILDREFHQLSESDDSPINQWLKLAKARGEMADTDPVLLKLIVELHNKIDALEMFLKDIEPKRVSLSYEEEIKSIGFEHFLIADDMLEVGKTYYGRIEMPIHPKRDVPVYFEAQSGDLAKILTLHERDEKEWNAYVTARERVLIRQEREKRR